MVLCRPELQFRRSLWTRIRRGLGKKRWQGKYALRYDTNLEHRMATVFRNAGLTDLKGGLHIFRRTFATRMYDNGARVKGIAAYIGDLESTMERYYIAVRKKIWEDGMTEQAVMVPAQMKKEEKEVKEKSEAAPSWECMRGKVYTNNVIPKAVYYPNGCKE